MCLILVKYWILSKSFLKFVRKNFLAEDGLELVCVSSGLIYKLGEQTYLETELKLLPNFKGTLIAIDWKKSGTKK